MHKISPCLWFDGQAEEAANFYVSLFENSRIVSVSHFGEEGSQASEMPKGSVMMVVFQLAGRDFMALNGGPAYKFTPAISLMVDCRSQEEVDYLWNRLTEGGAEVACGWLTDRFGLSWQIVPSRLMELMQDPDPVKSERVMHAMLQMKKIEIAEIEAAYLG